MMYNMCIMDNVLWKGQSITFKESAKLYPNLAEMNREGKKTSDKQWKQRETITKTNFK